MTRLEGIRVELHEYYEMSDLCILKPISEYIVYNDKGNIIGKVRDVRCVEYKGEVQ